MILLLLIGLLFVGGLLAWLAELFDEYLPRTVAITTLFIALAVTLTLLGAEADSEGWLSSLDWQWIPQFGISFYLAADGLSLLLLLLTVFLGIIAIAAAWDEIHERPGFFYFNLLWTLAGVVGVFTALDLFLFFFFWEVMLIPMYFIIAIWGHENKNYAAMKFFIFTQISGLLMLSAILIMAYQHNVQFGAFSFRYQDLMQVATDGTMGMLVMLGFFIAFTTKLPSVPFHSWLPDAHSQAPTAGSVILAGILFMLIPMYFIIAIWGHENKNYAAMKFFIFTQISGLLMLSAILIMAYQHNVQFGAFSFRYQDLMQVATDGTMGMLVMLGFFIAFTTKLPSVPFHSWLPDAHSQAPTAGSVILAGILLKTGAYGLIRFAVPLFPEESLTFAPVAMALAAISIVYCAKVAFAQDDIKRLIAYTSVSHMGFVTLGVYAWNEQALQGAVMTMLAHGLSAAALFMLAGGLQHRIHTRHMPAMGGFWAQVPRMSVVALFFSVAALGMPGLGNFIGEFLALLGAFQSNILFTAIAALGLILASVYSLWVIQKVFHGEYKAEESGDARLSDLNAREMAFFILMMLGLLWMGMYPQSFLALSEPVLEGLLSATADLSQTVGQL